MREQEIEENVREDFLDKNQTTSKEARSYAHDSVTEAFLDHSALTDPDLEALGEFPDLLEGVDDTLDIQNNIRYN
jgi:hypothetical protein